MISLEARNRIEEAEFAKRRRPWLDPYLTGSPNSFTHRIEGRSEVSSSLFVPRIVPPIPRTEKSIQNRFCFVVNTPLVASRDLKALDAKLKKLIQIFRHESFGSSPAQSELNANSRLCVVIGINRMKSIDPRINKVFIEYIKNLQLPTDIEIRVVGFFWKPSWISNDKVNPTPKVRKAFQWIRYVNPEAAKSLVTTFESRKGPFANVTENIPFQLIREKIKDCEFTDEGARKFTDASPKIPLYFFVVDGDILRLKSGSLGYFTCCVNEMVNYSKENKVFPDVISLGYNLPDSSPPIPRLGVKMDMDVRQAVSSVFGQGSYYPEPGFGIRIKWTYRISSLSFRGAGTALESRRLIQNALAMQYISENKMLFLHRNSLTTPMPARMVTNTNRAIAFVNKTNIGTRNVLSALRDVSQVHFHPHEWAENIYLALPIQYSQKTACTKHLITIFRSFDPISIAYDFEKIFNGYSPQCFFEMMRTYEALIKALQICVKNKTDMSMRSDETVKFAALFPSDIEGTKAFHFFMNHSTKLVVAYDILFLGNTNNGWVLKTVIAALESGKALYKNLKSLSSDPETI